MSDADQPSRPAAARYNVLIVEDDQTLRDELAEVFERESLTVVTAADGQGALEVLNHTVVDVLVVDLMMPGMSGWELAKAIRATPALADLPFMVITAVGNGHLSPVKQVFLKPLNVDSLVRAVKMHAKAGAAVAADASGTAEPLASLRDEARSALDEKAPATLSNDHRESTPAPDA